MVRAGLVWCCPFLLLLILALMPVQAAAQSGPGQPPLPEDLENLAPAACDPDGQQQSGAIYRICMPEEGLWNGDLVVYAHGYVRPSEPVGIPEDQMVLPGLGISVPDLITGLGYGFATSSYSTNGLAVRQGLADLRDVVELFAQKEGEPDTVYLVGVSEGGLITALAIEGRPDVFDGGLAMCGPYGDFAHQINHLGDMRAVFDYFFPGLIPGSPVEIPGWLVTGWDSYYETTVQPQLQDPANEDKVTQLLSVTGVTSEPNVAGAREQVIYDVLSYNVEGTNDAAAKLGGQPYDNQDRVYTGSDDDARLNREIQRFRASAQALAEIEAGYQTRGVLEAPLVTLHTTGDHVVPYWQAIRYRGKTITADNIALHEPRQVEAYGHCRFAPSDVLTAFNRLVAMVEDRPAYRPVQRAFLPVAPRIE